jgi:hypothetical protein
MVDSYIKQNISAKHNICEHLIEKVRSKGETDDIAVVMFYIN